MKDERSIGIFVSGSKGFIIDPFRILGVVKSEL
jgi:hypothetical protein